MNLQKIGNSNAPSTNTDYDQYLAILAFTQYFVLLKQNRHLN